MGQNVDAHLNPVSTSAPAIPRKATATGPKTAEQSLEVYADHQRLHRVACGLTQLSLNSKSNDLWSPHECCGADCEDCAAHNEHNDVEVVKIPFDERRIILAELSNASHPESALASQRSQIISQLSDAIQHHQNLMHPQEPSSLGMSTGQGQGGSNARLLINHKKDKEAKFVHRPRKMSKDTQESKESKIQI